ncbi:DUF4476 domain-containing protein [Flavobacterium sp.]|uniref:DUF4476 domain-containing protein n=1 Tax=Flavobacterium sp. TaxID=239 RepID=UPI002FDB740F
MKRNTTLLAFMLLLSSLSFAQVQPFGHLTIFSEDGDKFFLILNGERINDEPQTNLRVEELVQPYYNAKIIFEDNTRAEISKNFLQIADADGIFMDVTYKIRRDKNNPKKMKMNFFSMIPVVDGFIPPANVHVRRWGQPAPPPQVVVQQTVPTAVVQQTTTTTTTTGGVNAGVNIGGVGVNISINEPVITGSTTITETTTVTTGGTVVAQPRQPREVVVVDNNPSCVNRRPMNPNDFNAALQTIRNQGFDESRLKTAQQVAQNNCLNTNQIIEICKIFGFEETKLSFAKFAFDSCVEPRNYFKLNDIFSFSSSADELNDYISRK